MTKRYYCLHSHEWIIDSDPRILVDFELRDRLVYTNYWECYAEWVKVRHMSYGDGLTFLQRRKMKAAANDKEILLFK